MSEMSVNEWMIHEKYYSHFTESKYEMLYLLIICFSQILLNLLTKRITAVFL